MTPNILYIHSHDTGRYIQPCGHSVATPNLQRLAEQGVLFRSHFCHSPTCSPSRASMLTGRYAHENGLYGLAHRGFRLHDPAQHLVHVVRQAGYTTILAGMQHEARDEADSPAWQQLGYDQYLGPPATAHETAVSLLRHNPPQQPFFLTVGFEETHRPFPELDDNDPNPDYAQPPAPLPNTRETRRDMAAFNKMVQILDDKMGQVLAALDESGLADNTLVICTTDHGLAFPRMKCTLYDSGLGVMLLLRGPGGCTGGKVVDAMTSHLDIFPTVCDLLGLEPPEGLRGKSLLSLVGGSTEYLHEELFFEVNYHAAYEPQRAIRTGRWKYIRRFDNQPYPILPNCDNSPSKWAWLQNGWREQPPPDEALFDLLFDPNETNNLINAPSHKAIAADLRQRLTDWMVATDDPLRLGRMPAPETAVINPPDIISPNEVELFPANESVLAADTLPLVNGHLDKRPFFLEGGKLGVLLLHGLTATPAEVRLLAERLHAHGITIAAPLLPGHGTRPEDLNEVRWRDWVWEAEMAYQHLATVCDHVFVGGESTGGAIALHLAADHPEIAGVLAYAPAIKLALPVADIVKLYAAAPLIDAIPKENVNDNPHWQGYRVNPLWAVVELMRLGREVRRRLGEIDQPVLVVQGRQDETIAPECGEIIMAGVASAQKEMYWLEQSGHVVLLEDELGEITAVTKRFVERDAWNARAAQFG